MKRRGITPRVVAEAAVYGIAGMLFGMLLSCFVSYAHEAGHFLVGAILDLVYTHSLPKITNWVSCPFFPFLSMPQQVTFSTFSPVITLAGPIAGLAFVFVVLYAISCKLRFGLKWVLPLFTLFLAYETVGNIICGTDNWTALPLMSCFGLNNLLVGLTVLEVIYFGVLAEFLRYRQEYKSQTRNPRKQGFNISQLIMNILGCMVRKSVTIPIRGEVRITVDIEAEEKDGKIKPFERFVFVSSVFLILLFFMKSLPSFDNSPATYLYTKNCSNFSCTGCSSNQTGFVENLSLIPVPKVSNSNTTFEHLSGPLNNWGPHNCTVSAFDRYRYGADVLLVCWVLTLFVFAALISNTILPIFIIFFIIFFSVLIINLEILTTLILLIILIIALVLVTRYLTKKRISLGKIISLDKFLIASANTQLVLIFIGVCIWILNKVMPEKELFVSLMPCIPEGIGLWGIFSLLNLLLPGFYLILFVIFCVITIKIPYNIPLRNP